jgi:hypothetical protein
MRSTITAFALIGAIVATSPSFGQGTQSPGLSPKQAPVGHRQPRPSEVQTTSPAPGPPAASSPSQPDVLNDPDFDARLNRVLNSICRGC